MRTPGPTRPSKLWVTIGPLTLLKKSWTKCFRIFAKFCDKHCILFFHKSDEKNEIYLSDLNFRKPIFLLYCNYTRMVVTFSPNSLLLSRPKQWNMSLFVCLHLIPPSPGVGVGGWVHRAGRGHAGGQPPSTAHGVWGWGGCHLYVVCTSRCFSPQYKD